MVYPLILQCRSGAQEYAGVHHQFQVNDNIQNYGKQQKQVHCVMCVHPIHMLTRRLLKAVDWGLIKAG